MPDKVISAPKCTALMLDGLGVYCQFTANNRALRPAYHIQNRKEEG